MAQHQTSYPYPVLGHEDDFKYGTFKIDNVEDLVLTNDRTVIRFSIQLTSSYLESLLKDKMAKIIAEVTCKDTFLKHTYECSQGCEINLGSSTISGKVQVKAWLIAASDIIDYCPDEINDDYGEATFQIEAGDILAEAPGFWFIADKDFNAESAPTASFIKIGPGSEPEGQFEVSYNNSDGIINISMPTNDLGNYQNVAEDPELKQILHATIVLPVLMQGITGVLEGEDSPWFNQRLAAILKKKELLNEDDDYPNIYNIAQNLLQDSKSGSYPISRALNGANEELKEASPREDEDE